MLCGKINYKNLEIYQLAHEFVLDTYKFTEAFPQHEGSNLVSQMRRAACSVPLNIAEGTGGVSYRVFLNFLGFSYRSCLELQASFLLCRDLKYLDEEFYSEMYEKLDKLIRKLFCYMRTIEQNADKNKRCQSGYGAWTVARTAS